MSEIPTHHDRKVGLVIFGSVQILGGVLAALTVLVESVLAFDSLLSPDRSLARTEFALALIYSVFGTAALSLGIGSIQKKRWARALTLVGAWYTLVMGVLVTILLTAILPIAMRAQQRPQQTHQPSVAFTALILTLMICGIAFFLIVVPLAFVIFYSRRDVAETCRRNDPKERWTDRVPLPVLGASVVFAVGSLYHVALSPMVRMFPFFGIYLTGASRVVCLLVIAGLDAYISAGLFQRKRSAWWIATIAALARIVSVVVTLLWGDRYGGYATLGWSADRLNQINSNPILRSHVIVWWSLVSMLGSLVYLLWLKRYFDRSAVLSNEEDSSVVVSGFIAQAGRRFDPPEPDGVNS